MVPFENKRMDDELRYAEACERVRHGGDQLLKGWFLVSDQELSAYVDGLKLIRSLADMDLDDIRRDEAMLQHAFITRLKYSADVEAKDRDVIDEEERSERTMMERRAASERRLAAEKEEIRVTSLQRIENRENEQRKQKHEIRFGELLLMFNQFEASQRHHCEREEDRGWDTLLMYHQRRKSGVDAVKVIRTRMMELSTAQGKARTQIAWLEGEFRKELQKQLKVNQRR